MERLTALAPLVPAPPFGRAETVPLLSSHDGEQVLDVADSRARHPRNNCSKARRRNRAPACSRSSKPRAAARELAPEERAKHKAEHEAKDETRQRT
jgi:hypothetical protein